MQTHLMIAGTTGPKCLERLQETRMATLPTPALVIQVILLFIFAGSWDRFQNIRSPPAMLIKRQSNPGGPLVWKSPASRSVLVGTVQGGGYDCRFTSEYDFFSQNIKNPGSRAKLPIKKISEEYEVI